MYVFNGKITIKSEPIAIDGTSPQQWKFDVMLSSSNDKNKISKIKAGDFVILNGYDSASLESQYCAYKVDSISNFPVKSTSVVLIISSNSYILSNSK